MQQFLFLVCLVTPILADSVADWRVNIQNSLNLFATSKEKKLNGGYEDCCKHFGVDDGLAAIACRYPNYEALLQQTESFTDSKGKDKKWNVGKAQIHLDKCNLVKYWPSAPCISYCLHDGQSFASCVANKKSKDGSPFPPECSAMFAEGKAPTASQLVEDSSLTSKCIDFLPEMVECAREMMWQNDKSHNNYKQNSGPQSCSGAQSNVCSMEKSVLNKRKLFLKSCVKMEKLLHEKEGVSGPFVSSYNPDDCS